MSLFAKCILICSNGTTNKIITPQPALIYEQIRNYAARKGTREKARKRKVKVEEKKVGFIPHNLRDLDKIVRPKKKFDDSWKATTEDDVYPAKYYQWRVYPFTDAVQCHKETHHPTIYNEPNARVHAVVELNMQGEKVTRFVNNFTRMAPMPHKFDHGQERNILAFTKDGDSAKAALDAGAGLAGGVELIKDIQIGKLALQDFQFVVAHPDILHELVCLRGIMKRKFPNPGNGTLSPNLRTAVDKFVNGISYTATRDEYEKDFGLIDTIIGTLAMDSKHLEANFESLLKDIQLMKPKRKGAFITRCLLICPPSSEKLKVDHGVYVDVEDEKVSSSSVGASDAAAEDEESDNETNEKQVVVN